MTIVNRTAIRGQGKGFSLIGVKKDEVGKVPGSVVRGVWPCKCLSL